ncbi:hypothetical protein TNCT_342221 [Trichonephila clavata]|uniref:Uncharacterized protein n=1 Tax=Trichonephila clavata TaxID=2740835 RepID=A0A8X6JLX0_TRICU|nr:hypothetical protein TNCT_342221 [Trichonephila clavata]
MKKSDEMDLMSCLRTVEPARQNALSKSDEFKLHSASYEKKSPPNLDLEIRHRPWLLPFPNFWRSRPSFDEQPSNGTDSETRFSSGHVAQAGFEPVVPFFPNSYPVTVFGQLDKDRLVKDFFTARTM